MALKYAGNTKRKPEETWVAVEGYLDRLQIAPDAALEAALADSAKAGLPEIAVTPSQGKLLHLLAKMQGARRILEIGTLGGYSTIWLGRALPARGRLVTLEAEKKHAEVARRNIARAGLSGKVEVRLGPALRTLSQMTTERKPSFNLVFIDADKESTAEYFDYALRLSRAGSVIVVDNVIRDGEVANVDTDDPRAQGIRRFNEAVAREKRVSATTIQTVGSKGYDGFTLVLVLR
ncbi:MAG TPA: O-methyltransferase [Acidobacteriaceae bacterium]|nr:O-methyltransferase [Acidobacteriaceae bacterium]